MSSVLPRTLETNCPCGSDGAPFRRLPGFALRPDLLGDVDHRARIEAQKIRDDGYDDAADTDSAAEAHATRSSMLPLARWSPSCIACSSRSGGAARGCLHCARDPHLSASPISFAKCALDAGPAAVSRGRIAA
jgi:hypothetical protein